MQDTMIFVVTMGAAIWAVFTLYEISRAIKRIESKLNGLIENRPV